MKVYTWYVSCIWRCISCQHDLTVLIWICFHVYMNFCFMWTKKLDHVFKIIIHTWWVIMSTKGLFFWCLFFMSWFVFWKRKKKEFWNGVRSVEERGWTRDEKGQFSPHIQHVWWKKKNPPHIQHVWPHNHTCGVRAVFLLVLNHECLVIRYVTVGSHVCLTIQRSSGSIPTVGTRNSVVVYPHSTQDWGQLSVTLVPSRGTRVTSHWPGSVEWTDTPECFDLKCIKTDETKSKSRHKYLVDVMRDFSGPRCGALGVSLVSTE